MDNSHLIEFVAAMQKSYPNVIFSFEYNDWEKSYRIWHTYSNEFNDEEFLSYMGKLIKELFIPIKFFNFYIDFNAEYIARSKSLISWAFDSNQPMSCSFNDPKLYAALPSYSNKDGLSFWTAISSMVAVVSSKQNEKASTEGQSYRMAA